MVSVETYFYFRLSSRFLNADRPSPYRMFGYNPRTSIVNKIILKGNFGREWTYFRNSCPLCKILLLDLVAVNDGQRMKYF